MTPAILFALAAAVSTPSQSTAPQLDTAASAPTADAPTATAGPTSADSSEAPAASAEASVKPEDRVPAGAPKDDYGFVAWCHGALAGQLELDPVVEKDMDAIEGKVKAKERHVGDAVIAKERRSYLKEYERALSAAEKASPTAIHQHGVESELKGYGIWAATRNKQKVWRMVDWGNWEVPKRCEVVAKRLYDRSTLFGEALSPSTSTDAASTEAAPTEAGPTDAAPAGAAPDTAPTEKTSTEAAETKGSETGAATIDAPAQAPAAGSASSTDLPAADATTTTPDATAPATEPHPDPVADGLKGPH